MTVRAEKPSVNLREKLAELDKPTGIAGEAMLRAETPQEQQALIGVGRRNIIINGDMKISQRGTSFSLANDGYTLDRWQTPKVTSATATISQVMPDGNIPDGHTAKLKVEITASATTSSNNYLLLWTKPEGYDFEATKWGTAYAVPCTMSFWVRSSVAGNHAIFIEDDTQSRSYVDLYVINTANTWEYKTITIPPITSGTFRNGTNVGARVGFSLACGTDFARGSGVWNNTQGLGATGQVNLTETNGATWEVTGVQLELGKVATPFEHRSYGEELALCQRYYQTSSPDITPYRTFANYTATTAYGIWQFPVQMRAVPTVTFASSGWSIYSNAGLRTYTSSTTDGISRTALTQVITGSGWAAGYSSFARCTTANGITMDAEL